MAPCAYVFSVVMSSKSAVAIEVELQGADLCVRTLGAGAREWFAGAPWGVSNGTLLRHLVRMEDSSVMDHVKDVLNGVHTSSSAAAAGKLQLDVQLAHFKTRRYLPEHAEVGRCTERSVQIVEYVPCTLQLVVFPETKKPAAMAKQEKSDARQPVHKCTARALVVFNLPSTWQWVAQKKAALDQQEACECEPAESRGNFVDVTEDATRVPTLEHVVGSAHEYMGVFVVNRRASAGLEHIGKLAGSLEGIKGLLSDPMSLLDDNDKTMMQSFVAFFGKANACEDSMAQWVADCMEMHTGIATSDDSDCLAVSYRIKLPQALGGYESAWKSLYSFNLNKNAVSSHCALWCVCDDQMCNTYALVSCPSIKGGN
jgi:hypothetical protein